jgi:hypothetical protein
MDWIHVVQQLGFPTVVCGALMWGIWRTGNWFTKTVVDPLMQSHLNFVNKTGEAIDKILDLERKAAEDRQAFYSKFDQALAKLTAGKGTTI